MNLHHAKISALIIAGSVAFIGRAERPQPQQSSTVKTESNYKDLGQLLLTHFPSAPFPHPTRAEGHQYKTNFFTAAEHYADNSVGIFIPKNFKPTKKLDFVIHFHGWFNNVTNALQKYELPEQMTASGKNAILIVPQGPRNAPDSFGGNLEDPDGFKRFMADVLQTLRQQPQFKNCEIGKIILSGHSGGYQVISSILDVGGMTSSIQEIWLFGALYGRTEKFKKWLKNSTGRLINIYTANGGTKTETANLMSALKKEETIYFSKRKGCDRAVIARQPADFYFHGTTARRCFAQTPNVPSVSPDQLPVRDQSLENNQRYLLDPEINP